MPTENDLLNSIEEILETAKLELGLSPKGIRILLRHNQPAEVVKILLNTEQPSDGFITLREKKRLDLSIEYIILQDSLRGLLDDHYLEKAKKRLSDYGFNLTNNSYDY